MSAAIVAEARAWLGTPWRHAHRVKGGGVDCGQFLAGVFEACGVIPHVDPEPYPPDWHLHRSEERFLGLVERYATKVDGEALPGDVALFRFGRCISHGAIVVAWPVIIHAVNGRGVIEDDLSTNLQYAARCVGAWRMNVG